jgi:hypothetical protein
LLDTFSRLYKEAGRPQPKIELVSFLSARETMAAAGQY